jgi:hypothetical protein
MSLNSEPSRANTIWKHFAGMFGADALERKFGKSPPPEWNAMLLRLKEFEIDRGLRRLAYSGKPHVPSLPEFTKLCRAIGDASIEEGHAKPALPNPGTFAGDGWDIAGNMRLLKHITTVLPKNSKLLGEVLPCVAGPKGQWLSRPSAQQVASTAVLVDHKKAWTQEMREFVDAETGEIGSPPKAFQDRVWNEVIAAAMHTIAEELAR